MSEFKLEKVCKELSKHWERFATILHREDDTIDKETLKQEIKQLQNELGQGRGDGESLTHAALASYALEELEGICADKLFSHISFFPKIASSLVRMLGNRDGVFKACDATITILSTMLPREFFMFPHPRPGIVDGVQYDSLNYREEFVEKYRKELQWIVKKRKNSIKLHRYTIVLEDEKTVSAWRGAETLSDYEPPKLLADFLEDSRRYLLEGQNKTLLGPLQPEDISYSVGLPPEIHASALDVQQVVRLLLPEYVHKVDIFLKKTRGRGTPNLVRHFVENYHSAEGCALLVIRDPYRVEGKPLLETQDEEHLKDLGVRVKSCEIFDYSAAPDFVHFAVSGAKSQQACIKANIELRNQSVVLRYWASDCENGANDGVSTLQKYTDVVEWLAGRIAVPNAPPTDRIIELLDKHVTTFGDPRFPVPTAEMQRLQARKDQWATSKHRYSEAELSAMIALLGNTYNSVVDLNNRLDDVWKT